MNILEVERHDRFERIEAAPSEEDGHANSGEDAVSPERVWDDSRSAQLLLTTDPIDEDGDHQDGQCKEHDARGLPDRRTASGNRGKHV